MCFFLILRKKTLTVKIAIILFNNSIIKNIIRFLKFNKNSRININEDKEQ